MSAPKWRRIVGPADGGNGTYTDRLKVPSGWIYRVEEWGTGGVDGKLLHRAVVFVPAEEKDELCLPAPGEFGFNPTRGAFDQ